MGGIGKTELATEYIHRNIDKYEIIWWIRAEHHDRVREALVKLAQRLELRQASTDSGRDRTITAVLETLQSEAGRAGCWCTTTRSTRWICSDTCHQPAGRPHHHHLTAAELAKHT